jgi:hypothetical protein
MLRLIVPQDSLESSRHGNEYRTCGSHQDFDVTVCIFPDRYAETCLIQIRAAATVVNEKSREASTS